MLSALCMVCSHTGAGFSERFYNRVDALITENQWLMMSQLAAGLQIWITGVDLHLL